MENVENDFGFWLQKSNESTPLSRLARSAFVYMQLPLQLSVIFGKSGLILRPHKSSMSSASLAMKVYLQ